MAQDEDGNGRDPVGMGGPEKVSPTGPAEASQPRRQPTQEEMRKKRAAAKLRENLSRRKEQTRARRKGEAETGSGLPASRPHPLPPEDED